VTLWLKSTSRSDRNDRHAEESREDDKRSRYVQEVWRVEREQGIKNVEQGRFRLLSLSARAKVEIEELIALVYDQHGRAAV
jgi:hypothetical protein